MFLLVYLALGACAGVLAGLLGIGGGLLLVAALAFGVTLRAGFWQMDRAQQKVAAQANRAAGDVWWPTIMHFVAYGAVMMPLGWVLAHRMGVDGLVWAIVIASLASSVLLTGRFVRVARRLP